MLVIRRRLGERILVGDNVEIEILDARQNYVKLGIKAPDSVSIVREEAQLTRESNLHAAQTSGLADLALLAAKLSR